MLYELLVFTESTVAGMQLPSIFHIWKFCWSTVGFQELERPLDRQQDEDEDTRRTQKPRPRSEETGERIPSHVIHLIYPLIDPR